MCPRGVRRARRSAHRVQGAAHPASPMPLPPCPMPRLSGVKDAQRSRRQSIWAVYTSLRHTAKYTGFGCISYIYSLLASSRLACQDIQRIQHIQPIQPYSHTRHTSYSTIHPPSGRGLLVVGGCLAFVCLDAKYKRVASVDTL